MIGIYFSGTGNTKHCVEKLVHISDDTAKTVPLEDSQITNILEQQDGIFRLSNVFPAVLRREALWKTRYISNRGLHTGSIAIGGRNLRSTGIMSMCSRCI